MQWARKCHSKSPNWRASQSTEIAGRTPLIFLTNPREYTLWKGKITRTRKKKEKQNKEKLEAFVARFQWVKNSRFFQEKEERERDREREGGGRGKSRDQCE